MRLQTWKRLTFALVMVAVAGLIGPVSLASATSTSDECASNQGTIKTPYARTFCAPCPAP